MWFEVKCKPKFGIVLVSTSFNSVQILENLFISSMNLFSNNISIGKASKPETFKLLVFFLEFLFLCDDLLQFQHLLLSKKVFIFQHPLIVIL